MPGFLLTLWRTEKNPLLHLKELCCGLSKFTILLLKHLKQASNQQTHISCSQFFSMRGAITLSGERCRPQEKKCTIDCFKLACKFHRLIRSTFSEKKLLEIKPVRALGAEGLTVL